MRISVVILTLNASSQIDALLYNLMMQTLKPDEIIVVDSESDDETVLHAKAHPRTRVISINREEFDHGGTRDMALKASIGDIILFLTQDATIINDKYIEWMVGAANQNKVACVCGRQIAKGDAPLYEKYTREFNYPAASFIRNAGDIDRLGIKAYFLSDVCSAYCRKAYLEVGGFERPILTNEDMLIAAKFLHADYQIAYCAEAMVEHSHHYNFRQEFERNYKIGFVIRKYQKLLDNGSTIAEGFRYVRFVIKKLLARFALLQCVRFCFLCVVKFLGVTLGKRAAEKMEASLFYEGDCGRYIR